MKTDVLTTLSTPLTTVPQRNEAETGNNLLSVLDLCGHMPAERQRFYELLADVLVSIAVTERGQEKLAA